MKCSQSFVTQNLKAARTGRYLRYMWLWESGLGARCTILEVVYRLQGGGGCGLRWIVDWDGLWVGVDLEEAWGYGLCGIQGSIR